MSEITIVFKKDIRNLIRSAIRSQMIMLLRMLEFILPAILQVNLRKIYSNNCKTEIRANHYVICCHEYKDELGCR